MINDFPIAPSVYIHVPFCRSKCPYCDFYSQVGEPKQLDGYAELLLQHLAFLQESEVLTAPLQTVFFGGGTPSLLHPNQIAALLEQLRQTAGLTADAEISLEVNPGTVDLARLHGYHRAGVNRLSFGIQSLQDRSLQMLGRGHTRQQAEQAVTWGRQAGFENISCDLMFGLPGQGPDELLQDLDALLRLQPEHLSCYGLTVEEGTPFEELQRTGVLALPDEELFRQLYLTIHERLSSAGFDHYEISNYARPGYACRHNLAYWRRRPCVAVGAGAHAFRDAGYGLRRAVPADLMSYARALGEGRDPAETIETFDQYGAMAETLYLGLRCREGVGERDFRERFGVAVGEVFSDAIRRCGERLRLVNGRWQFDLQGWLLYDHFISYFL